MKRIILALSVLLMFSTHEEAVAASDWTPTDTALQVTYAAVHVMDWSQTRWISRNNVVWQKARTEISARVILF